tara:strand:+ start:53 stop:571 length:519 start_codon:yes stop_codon:yes gene_type:complete
MLIQKERRRLNRTSSGVALWQQLNHFQMKKFVLSLFAVAAAFVGTAQDAGQPQGSWYLGTGDATTLLNVFSSGVAIAPSVGYAVADDIVITAKAGFGGAFDALDLSLGGQYFMGDYYVGLDLSDPINDLDLGLNAGRYIDFKDVLYVAPQLNIDMLLNDPAVGVSIGFGARF